MDYLTVKEAALKWNISERSVANYCANNRIPGAKCIGKQWLIPSTSERPTDGRFKSARQHTEITPYHFPLFVHSPCFVAKSELSAEESMLFDAEMLYLAGDYSSCIIKCRQIHREAISPNVIFGAHYVIGYAAMLLGLYTDFHNSVLAMERIISNETAHKADYQLMLVGLNSHATRNFTLLPDIDTDKLSLDALYYYRYLLMMSSFVNLTTENKNTVLSYLSFLRELEIIGITPTVLCVNSMLSTFFKRLGDTANQRLYLQKACDIAVQTHYNSLFSKYYVVQHELMDEFLSKYGNDYITIMKKVENDIMIKWLIVHKLSSGFAPIPAFTIMQNEILILMPGAVPLETIAKIKNLPLEKVEEEVNTILKISGVKSLDKLPKYVRERLKEMPEAVKLIPE